MIGVPDNCRVNLFVNFAGKQAETDSDFVYLMRIVYPEH